MAMIFHNLVTPIVNHRKNNGKVNTILKKTTVNWKQTARWDDVFTITNWCLDYGRLLGW